MQILMLDIKRSEFIILISAALLCALAMLLVPLQIFSAAVCLFFILVLYLKFPKTIMLALGVFLLFQDLIAFWVSDSPLLVMALKRSEEAIVLLAFIIMVLKGTPARRLWKEGGIGFPLLCLILIATMSSVKNHIVPYTLAGFDLFLLLKGFFVFYIFYNLNLDANDIRRVLKVFFVVSLTVLVLGIVDLITPTLFRNIIHNVTFVDYRFGIPSVQSIFIHPGVLGWFMAFFAIFYFVFFLIFKKKRCLVFTFLFALGALLSMRFKPVAGLLAAISVAFFLVPSSKKIKFIFIIGSVIIILGCYLGPKVNLLFDYTVYKYLQSANLTNLARNAFYSTGFCIAKDFFPLGSGLATFGGWIAALHYSPLYTQYGLSTIHGLQKGGPFLTDTFWPYLIAQFGLIGTACYVWILISFFHGAVVVFKRKDDLYMKAFAFGTVLILVEAIVETMADPVFLKPPQYFFIFACLGITHSLKNRADKTINSDENTSS